MKKCFITAILFAMIFLSFGKAKAEVVQVYDSGLYTMTNTLAENGLKITYLQKVISSDGLYYEYFYQFNDYIWIDFAVNGDGYISAIHLLISYDADVNDYQKVVYQICKVLGMTDEMAEYMFYNRRGLPNDVSPNVKVNNRAIIFRERNVIQHGVIGATFGAFSLD